MSKYDQDRAYYEQECTEEMIRMRDTARKNKMTDNSELLPDFCTLRDAADAIHLECRFPNGQKYAPVTVDADNENLAQFLADCINNRLPRLHDGENQ